MRISPEEVTAQDREKREETKRILKDWALFLILAAIVTFICVLG